MPDSTAPAPPLESTQVEFSHGLHGLSGVTLPPENPLAPAARPAPAGGVPRGEKLGEAVTLHASGVFPLYTASYCVQFENHGPGARRIADPRDRLVQRTRDYGFQTGHSLDHLHLPPGE
jgi:hypothetical protein